MFYTITKGEMSVIRSALEEGDPEDKADALAIVNSIIQKNVLVTISPEQMYKDPLADELSEAELEVLHAAGGTYE